MTGGEPSYLTNNRAFIPNYGERYRQGKIISTRFTESAVSRCVGPSAGPPLTPSPLSSIERDWRFTLSQWYPGMQTTPELEAA
jgi:hypothetical protein